MAQRVRYVRFSALQRAENSSIKRLRIYNKSAESFQCSSASRKFLNRYRGYFRLNLEKVSVLFSEPKIPQSYARRCIPSMRVCFSALQRAENSSMGDQRCQEQHVTRFQCSSASRKFLNSASPSASTCGSSRFQCSSASRKFLNRPITVTVSAVMLVFQCSSASRKFLN